MIVSFPFDDAETIILAIRNTQEVFLKAPREILPTELLGLGLLSWCEWISTLDSLGQLELLIVGRGDILVAKKALLSELCLT